MSLVTWSNFIQPQAGRLGGQLPAAVDGIDGFLVASLLEQNLPNLPDTDHREQQGDEGEPRDQDALGDAGGLPQNFRKADAGLIELIVELGNQAHLGFNVRCRGLHVNQIIQVRSFLFEFGNQGVPLGPGLSRFLQAPTLQDPTVAKPPEEPNHVVDVVWVIPSRREPLRDAGRVGVMALHGLTRQSVVFRDTEGFLIQAQVGWFMCAGVAHQMLDRIGSGLGPHAFSGDIGPHGTQHIDCADGQRRNDHHHQQR